MKRLIVLLSLVAFSAAPILAQSAPPPPSRPSPTPTAPPQGPPRPGQNQPPPPSNNQAPAAPMSQQGQQGPRNDSSTWQNVKIDLLITDTGSPNPKKLITLLVTDGWSGQIRSNTGQGVINVDAAPKVRPDGRIFLHLTMEYQPELVSAQDVQAAGGRLAFLNESLTLVVLDGKSTLASQSADPRSDRKVTVEVVATVMKEYGRTRPQHGLGVGHTGLRGRSCLWEAPVD